MLKKKKREPERVKGNPRGSPTPKFSPEETCSFLHHREQGEQSGAKSRTTLMRIIRHQSTIPHVSEMEMALAQLDQVNDSQATPSRWVRRLLSQVEATCKETQLMGEVENIKKGVLDAGLDWFMIQGMSVPEIMGVLRVTYGFAHLLREEAIRDRARNGKDYVCGTCMEAFEYDALLRRHMGLSHVKFEVSPSFTPHYIVH